MMTVELRDAELDQIFNEMKNLVNNNDKLEEYDLNVVRVLIYNDRARNKGLLKTEIIEEIGSDKQYKIGKSLRKLVSYNIIGELPNLLDMRVYRYYLRLFGKYRRNE